MPLKTFVKVGKITNLSDARYCSGMGVDMLGFQAVDGLPHFIPSPAYQEIRGWISGPAIVAEIYGLKGTHLLPAILENYRPDYLELKESQLAQIAPAAGLPLIVKLETGSELAKWKDSIAYLQADENELPRINDFSDHFPIIVELQSGDRLNELLDQSIKGISLNGSPEMRPGYKDYGALADILEMLECED